MRRSTTIAALGLALVLGATGAVAQNAEKTKPPLTPVAQELEKVRKNLTNAQSKLNRGAVGIQMNRAQSAPLTPGQACCSGNLQHIDDGIKEIRRLVRERGVCFERQRDREGVEIVNLVNQDLRALLNGVQIFAESTAPAEVQGALHGCTRAYLNLKRSTESMKDCSTD